MLNDNELRALLDEAITYKRPKDREGKSNLFKVRMSFSKLCVEYKSYDIKSKIYRIMCAL